MTRRLPLVLAFLLGLTGCAADIPTIQKRLEPHYRIGRPPGQGPFAAVLLVPGCGGISPARLQTARQLVRDGYVVAFVDYLASRGLTTACRGEVTADEVAQDISAASAHVRSLPYVRSTGIGAVGWSFGGAGVLASLAASAPNQTPPFNAGAAFYPVCAGLQSWKANVPVLLLLAALDDIAPPAPCHTLVRSVGPAAPVVVHVYPNARHSFDVSDLPPVAPSRAFSGKTIGYDAEATRQAWAHVAALFDRHLRQSK